MTRLDTRLKRLEKSMQAAGLDDEPPPEGDVWGQFWWAGSRLLARQAQQPTSGYSGPDARNPFLIFVDAVHRLSPEDLARLSPEDVETSSEDSE